MYPYPARQSEEVFRSASPILARIESNVLGVPNTHPVPVLQAQNKRPKRAGMDQSHDFIPNGFGSHLIAFLHSHYNASPQLLSTLNAQLSAPRYTIDMVRGRDHEVGNDFICGGLFEFEHLTFLLAGLPANSR